MASDILKTVEEVREVESVLYDMIHGSDLYAQKDLVLTLEVVTQIKESKRFVVGQIIMLVTRSMDGIILSSAPCIVTKAIKYTFKDTPKVEYACVLLLGKLNSSDDVSAPFIISGDLPEEKVSTVIPSNIIGFIKHMVDETSTIKNTIALKEKLEIPHFFCLENEKFKSLY